MKEGRNQVPFYNINGNVLIKKNLPLFSFYEMKIREAKRTSLAELYAAKRLLSQEVARRSLVKRGR